MTKLKLGPLPDAVRNRAERINITELAIERNNTRVKDYSVAAPATRARLPIKARHFEASF